MISPPVLQSALRSATLADVMMSPDDWALAERFTLRVAGWSMFPALRKGDRLTIGPADVVSIGDLLLYETAGGLCCHRAVARRDTRWIVRGDAMEGDGEAVDAGAIRGKVIRIQRGRMSVPLTAPPTVTPLAHLYRWVDLRLDRCRSALQLTLRRLLHWITAQPAIERYLLARLSLATGPTPALVEARIGRLVLASLHRPSGTIVARAWLTHLPWPRLFRRPPAP